jgi:hypothetical protein
MLSEARAGLLAPLCAWLLRWAVPISVAILVVVQLHANARLYPRWIGWSDQDYYLQSARAWAHGNLDPSQHHYPPGYALLAAPFVYLTPSQPFLIPDLVCSALTLVLFTRVCRRLAPDLPHVGAVAAICFLGSTALGETATDLWVVPWTTTAAAPLLLTSLLMALRFSQSLRLPDLFGLGLAAGFGAAVRPSDAALIFAICGAYCAVRLVMARSTPLGYLSAVLVLAGGLAIGLLPGLVAHVLVHGFSAGGYLGSSAGVGFEWRLIPLRWVTLAISPRPLFPQGSGMAAVFPWLLPGIAGMILTIAIWHRPAAGANLFVAVAIVAYWALYLSYRDLHPTGLWRYNNVHYFKWTLPFLLFWAVGQARALKMQTSRGAALAALGAACLLFWWRPVFVPAAQGMEAVHGLAAAVPGGLAPIDRVFILEGGGAWNAAYFGRSRLLIGAHAFFNPGDYKIFPGHAGLMLMPMRSLPEGDATIVMPAGVVLPRQAHWTAGTSQLEFGVPCLLTPRWGDCKAVSDVTAGSAGVDH